MWKEFKEFAFKGNVIDLAVGVMIGSAFGSIVSSLVADIFTPILSLITGRINFSTLAVKLGEGENAASINYGMFIQSVIDFLLMAVCIFAMVKLISRFKKPAEAAPESRKCPYCKGVIDQEATRCPHCTSQLSA